MKPPPDAEDRDSGQTVAEVCRKLNEVLRPARLHFGKRVEREMLDFLGQKEAASAKVMLPDLDFLLVSKILPKLRGTENELERVLWQLLYFCHPASWPGELKRLDLRKFNDIESLAKALMQTGDSRRQDSRTADITNPDEGEPARFDLPHSAEKLRDMLRRLHDTGFTSFF